MSDVHWHVITGEYPPQPGGVSDYTRLVAEGLAARGGTIDVWAPAADAAGVSGDRVRVHRIGPRLDPRSLARLSRELRRRPTTRRLLVQYVPQAFGYKGMNVPFCLWLRAQRDPVWVMFHEVAFPRVRGQGRRRNVLARVTRVMARLVAQSAERIFVSIPAWRRMLHEMTPVTVPVQWLPIPSTVPVVSDAERVRVARRRYVADGQVLVGHFGTYGRLIAEPLIGALPPLLGADGARTALLLGRGGEAARERLIRSDPSLASRVHAPGALEAADLSVHLAACDLMLQPYADGVSSRRTSAMAALAHGRALATTSGPLTEPLWSESQAAALAPIEDTDALVHMTDALLRDATRRDRTASAGRALYDERFALRHTLDVLTAVSLATPGAALAGGS